MLLKIMSEGPTTVGIFRRSPNARAMRELRERLDNAEDVDFAECSVFVAAALLKVYMRERYILAFLKVRCYSDNMM